MQPQTTSIRRARRNDIGKMSRMLAEAFVDDPAQRWLFPDDKRRVEHGTRLFEILSGMPMGQQAWTTTGVLGGAVWFEPGAWPISAVEAARRAPQMLALLGRRAPLVLTGLAVTERSHPRGRDHWYLANVGTHPAHRGKGIATALLNVVLDVADREGMPAYLEATAEGLVEFFARWNFSVSGQVKIPFGPKLHQMWREPQRPRR